MGKELPKRKPTRLKNYDYSSPGAYFLTICTASRHNYFWISSGIPVGDGTISYGTQGIMLSDYGQIAAAAIQNINHIYPTVTIDHYVIMPNHIHLLLQIHPDEHEFSVTAPTTDRIVQQMKGYITKQIGKPIWQKLYHDHVVRNKKDYCRIAKCIHENPLLWQYDCFYSL